MITARQIELLLFEFSENGVSQTKAAQLAGINPGHLSYVLNGHRSAKQTVLGKLRAALRCFRLAPETRPTEKPIWVAYCATFALIARMDDPNAPVADLISQDPTRRATKDPVWMQAARVRQQTLSILNQYFGIPQAQLARVANSSKSQVCLAIQKLEDERDENPALDARLDELGAMLGGMV